MYYIYILNDFEIGNNILNAEQILDSLVGRKCWVYNSTTPNFKRINRGDKVLVYMAGVGRRNFVASFNIASDIVEKQLDLLTKEESILFNMFSHMVKIENINIFQKPVTIAEIKNDLEFISDKKNYGLFFRQATKRITQQDYEKVISASQNFLTV
ncbi:EVE domain-containing protein [Ectobacillus sp. JY-23]|uniref:EVE domain-containing protein n=1 Tax=Ectobacillus sp. JY-23 TaxID=2933872 RepID=UPI001FF4783A|nr:EVE domain-containing protein [Ectobacillus sp. JY-23]UOY92506.1 EVE domain-containing protein [Ectobacillus sp. JY-23]